MVLIYDTERLKLITPNKQYLESIIDYQKRNKDFLEIWEPKRPDNYYTAKYQKMWIKEELAEIKKLTGLCLIIVKRDEPWKVIGNVKLSNIVYGNFCSCFLGYRLDKCEVNNGYMTEAVKKTLEIAFCELNLHRVEASVIPSNEASKKVLKNAGFRCVGSSVSYLKIYDTWQPHDIYEFINPND